jgi:CRP-like cAMP-binding protein
MFAVNIRQAEVRNRILASLPAGEFCEIAPLLEPFGLKLGKWLYEQGQAVPHIHFMESGLVSLISMLEDGASIEVAALGHEGLGGLSVLLGAEVSAHAGLVQTAGSTFRMRTEHAREAFRLYPVFQDKILRFTRLQLTLISQTAACNTLHTIQERLARWMLICRRRTESDTLTLTQEFLSHMLGVRRSGVTVVIGIFEQSGLIRHSRKLIHILDPEGLRKVSCECVNVLSEEYDNFFED